MSGTRRDFDVVKARRRKARSERARRQIKNTVGGAGVGALAMSPLAMSLARQYGVRGGTVSLPLAFGAALGGGIGSSYSFLTKKKAVPLREDLRRQGIKLAAWADELAKLAYDSQGWDFRDGKIHSDYSTNKKGRLDWVAKRYGVKVRPYGGGGGWHATREVTDPEEKARASKVLRARVKKTMDRNQGFWGGAPLWGVGRKRYRRAEQTSKALNKKSSG
jgi:hypothetical protein